LPYDFLFRLSEAVFFASSRTFFGNSFFITSSSVNSRAFFFRLGIGGDPVKFEEEIEQLLRGSISDLADVAAVIEASDEASVELFRILQKQIRAQGQAILRLAAAIDGLGHEPS
jgi:hypothetical protein